MRRFLPLAVLVFVIGGWEGLSCLPSIPEWLLPSPVSVVRVIATSAVLRSDIKITAGEFLVAFVIASVLGIAIGAALAKVPLFRTMTYPYIVIFGSLPASCFAPIITLWLGIGYLSKVIVGIIMASLVIITATTTGVAHIPKEVEEAAKLDGAKPLTLLLKIDLPLALPNIFTGLRMGWAMALIGAVVSELYGAYGGLGYYIFVQT